MSRIVAIHQPNFFPWLGYFNKIVRSDCFILMDNAQFPKKGGSWLNRVQIFIGDKPSWLTIPVDRSYHGVLPCSQIQLKNALPWREDILKTIQMNCAKTPCFKDVFPVLEAIINHPAHYLAEFNINAIQTLLDLMDIGQAKLTLGSSLQCNGAATDLLISMVKAVDGDTYLCGGGASGYQEDDKFKLVGLKLQYQDFQHPQYPQCHLSEFTPGLSIIDALMNCGFEQTGALIYAQSLTAPCHA